MNKTVPLYGFVSGGAALNFTVKTYPSEVELKADKPKENTIGVITTTTMTKWVFSATEPKEPEVGMVWISVGKESSVEFNALKTNTLQVYPNTAKQYVNSAFADVVFFIYKGGAWVEKTLMPPSAGWDFTKIFSKSTLGDCSFDGDVFVGSYSSWGRGAGIIKSIDFTEYKYIEVYYTLKNKDTESTTSPGYGGVVILVTDHDLNSNSNEIASKWNTNKDTKNGFVSIDVSGITGVHKLVTGIRGYSGTNINNEVRITKIKGVE